MTAKSSRSRGTAGTKITIPAFPATLAEFADELANDVQSNFVSIASPAQQNAST